MKPVPRRSRTLSVVIPAYDEEDRLPRTVPAVHAFLTEREYDAEIIVVDDGSQDQTRERIADLQPQLSLLRILSHVKNTGKDFAVLTGIKAATRDAILFTDADLSTPIEDLDRLWASFDEGFDIVVGSRGHWDSSVPLAKPPHRRIAGQVFKSFGLSAVRPRNSRHSMWIQALSVRRHPQSDPETAHSRIRLRRRDPHARAATRPEDRRGRGTLERCSREQDPPSQGRRPNERPRVSRLLGTANPVESPSTPRLRLPSPARDRL